LNPSIIDGSALKNGVFEFSSSDLALGHHAICIIGYNDTLAGGSFEVAMNYGLHYGDNGFGYIRYSDFVRFVNEAYVIELNQQDWPTPENEQTILKVPTSLDKNRVYAGWELSKKNTGHYGLKGPDFLSVYIQPGSILFGNPAENTDAYLKIVGVLDNFLSVE
jgi:hypothetical protein